jgi:hypothetical protein
MRRATGWFALLFAGQVLLTAGQVARAEGANDMLREPAGLRFSGNATFPADELRRAVCADLDVIMASHAGAPLADYLTSTSEALRRGYLSEGFPNARMQVTANEEQGHLDVTIQEGPRYLAGDVQLEGAETISPERLTQWLTEHSMRLDAASTDLDGRDGVEPEWLTRKSDSKHPARGLWQAGEPAGFDQPNMKALEEKIRDAYKAAGRHAPKFRVELVPEPEKKTAYLAVEILDEGPESRVEEIEITGNEKNTREEVLAYLKAEPGMLLTRAERVRIERSLWQSARFRKFTVTSVPPVKAMDKFKLQIKLTEYAPAPRLSEPFSVEESALLKCRDWLLESSRRGDDFVMRTRGDANLFEAVISFDHGVLVWTGEFGKSLPEGLQYAAVMSDRSVGLYSKPRKAKFEGLPERVGVILTQSLTLSKGGGRPFRYMIGCGAKTIATGSPPEPCRPTNRFEPVAMLAMAHQEELQCRLSEGVLTVDGSEFGKLRVKVETGEMIEFGFSKENKADAEPTKAAPVDGAVNSLLAHSPDGSEADWMIVRPARGAFDDRLKEIRQATAGFQPPQKSPGPLSSMLRFGLERELWALMDQEDEPAIRDDMLRAVDFAAKLLDRGLLSPLDASYSELIAHADSEAFSIPSTDPKRTVTTEDSAAELLAMFSSQMPGVADRIFPRHSWAWTITREAALASSGRLKYSLDELSRGLAPEAFGPLACWSIATGASSFKMLPVQQRYATEGLRRLQLADFRRDCRILLDPDCLAGQCALKLAETVRLMNEDEAQYLISLAPSKSDWLTPLVQTLRENSQQPLGDALQFALDRAWQAGWSEQTRAALQALLDPPAKDEIANRSQQKLSRLDKPGMN